MIHLDATSDDRALLSALSLGPGYPPSTYAIDDLVEGRDGGLARTAVLTLARTAIIAPGLWLAGHRTGIARTSLIVSGTVTLGMIAVKLWQRTPSGT